LRIFVGRGFSHDMNLAKSVRLYRLRKNSQVLWVVPLGTT
jgi:hypothetical protein